MVAILRERLVQLEQQFLLAVLSSDEEALQRFSREWSQLSNQIKNVEDSRILDDKMALLFSRVSGSIEKVAGCLLQCEAILLDAQSHLIHDLTQEIPSNELETSPHPPSITPYQLLFSQHPSSGQAVLGQNKALDAHAYRWLMGNLHNPYPSTLEVQILADVSETSSERVERWFKETRDSIGWTKLSRDFFASSPSATVAAVKQIHLKGDNNMPFGIIFAFTAMKARAGTLFLEHPALQEKHFGIDHDLSLALPGISEEQRCSVGPEGVFVPFQVDSSTPPDNLSYLSSSNESDDEEDTTPPPAVAGYKRRLCEDDHPSGDDTGSVRAPKRYCMSHNEGALSNQESTTPAVLNPGPLDEQNVTLSTPLTAAEMVTMHTSANSSSMPSYKAAILSSHKRRRTEFDEDTPENSASYIDVPLRPINRRKLMKSTSLLPSKEVYNNTSITPTNHPSLDLSPPSGGSPDHSSSHTLQSATEPASIGSDVPSNLCVFDWNSIPIPLQDAASMSSPAYSYVPSSNLPGSNLPLPHPPDLGHQLLAELSPPCSFGNLPSLGDLNCLSLSTVSNPSSTLVYSEAPSILQGIDWPSLTEFIDQPSAAAQSSSQISLPTTSTTVLSSQEGSLSFPLPPSCGIDRFASLLDPSTPPSAVLSAELDAFATDVHMWPLLYGLS